MTEVEAHMATYSLFAIDHQQQIANRQYKIQLMTFLVYAYVATLTVASLAVGIRMRYLAISGEDVSTYLLMRAKSCFSQ